MIDDAKVILAPTRINTFKKNKGVSPTSIPVKDVEAWLDEHPHKRNNGEGYQIKVIPFNNVDPNKQIRLDKAATRRRLIAQEVASKKKGK